MNYVPRLDLAPKLKRPLSPLRLKDYAKLLIWVFFSPQTVRCYVEKFSKDNNENSIYHVTFNTKNTTIWSILVKNNAIHTLIVQGLVLIIFSYLLLLIYLYIGLKIYLNPFFPINILFLSMLSSFPASYILSKKLRVDNLFVIISGIVSAILFGVSFIFINLVYFIFIQLFQINIQELLNSLEIVDILLANNLYKLPILFSFCLSMIGGLTTISGVNFGFSISWRVGIIIIIGSCFYWLFSLPLLNLDLSLLINSIILGIVLIPICLFASSRLLSWLIYLPLTLKSPIKGKWYICQVTPLPILGLSKKLTQWLNKDWETGVYNADQLLRYSLQFNTVIEVISQCLTRMPSEKIIFSVSILTEQVYDWRLISCIEQKLLKNLSQTEKNELYNVNYPLSSSAYAYLALSGFSSFHKSAFAQLVDNNSLSRSSYNYDLQKSLENFKRLRSLVNGEEIFTLVKTLEMFVKFFEVPSIADLKIPNLSQHTVLKPQTWQVIHSLYEVVKDIKASRAIGSASTRVFTLKRALEKLNSIEKEINFLPDTEKNIIYCIVISWKYSIHTYSERINESSLSNKPVQNPYTIGDPVEEKGFVGRADIIKQLEEIWILSQKLQSILLYGHRRMGKSSILKNVSDQLGSKVKLAYINLNGLGDIAGVDEVFMAITDAIAEELNIAPPADQDLNQSPYPTFRRYLKHIAQNNLTEYSLIIALDEFEIIEDLINTKKISSDFLGFLRSMMQLSSKIAFAFAGLHTLDEMTADYFQPFFASIIPIRVNFLSQGATRQLLANPHDEFPLDYQPEALDLIYQLTFGQPYLVQLIGFFLVRHYNDQVFEMGKPHDPILTIEDVNTIINNPEFFKNGRYYFTGVWGQASHNAPAQQEILRAIAPYPQGLDILSIEAITGIDQTILETALKTLERHDVIQEKAGKWSIIVELFRRWVEKEKMSNS